MQPRLINTSSIYSNLPGAVHAIRFGDTIYTSAILPKDSAGHVAGKNDVTAQAESMFANLRAVLASGGARLDQIARVNCYVDPAACAHLERVYEVRDKFLKRGAQ